MESKPSDSLEFSLHEVDRKIADLLSEMPKPASYSAWHAVRHLNRAWKIRQIDPEMAMFRSITAEEEAATALFLSLQRRNYDAADRLQSRSHIHKSAVIPFVVGMQKTLSKWPTPPKFELTFHDGVSEGNRLLLRFDVQDPLTGEEKWAYPEPPLDFELTKHAVAVPKPLEDFRAGMEELVSEINIKSFEDFLRKRANVRNRLLYAGSGGLPGVSGDIEAGLALYQANVFWILRTYMLIDPYSTKQPFAQQALYAFLKLLNQLPQDVGF